MAIIQVLNFMSAGSAFVAALFWFLSASGKAPDPPFGALSGAANDDPYFTHAQRVARLNQGGAAFAGLSALLMGVALLIAPGS
ncbi:hypothetical protein HUE56_30035 (plasmid) [Azospirillum oryzae]|uniref:Uncharacterized protein n=1 Tax=Azospirillum oryzae TaxID=286727 RepID=A0A6N1B6C9_9PROT|nr:MULTISPECIES: hypothetical protein [Azospirillum]KAA0584264.1 hypothetical protein FZ938_30225 [Azospirillum oryzae]QCG99282.1 hypothetical protein E6C67_36455 [Azospirillum sp. TSA2s]QKS54742.1 hypothetical protein HUE56_30035 [Azospirillum oryzae]GLR83048.1 hypothetical protein GCM10007856_57560 [Azospirillum oryzae]